MGQCQCFPGKLRMILALSFVGYTDRPNFAISEGIRRYPCSLGSTDVQRFVVVRHAVRKATANNRRIELSDMSQSHPSNTLAANKTTRQGKQNNMRTSSTRTICSRPATVQMYR